MTQSFAWAIDILCYLSVLNMRSDSCTRVLTRLGLAERATLSSARSGNADDSRGETAALLSGGGVADNTLVSLHQFSTVLFETVYGCVECSYVLVRESLDNLEISVSRFNTHCVSTDSKLSQIRET